MSMVPSIPGAFSVIVATRDRPELLVDALAGVAAQMLAPLETRVADDGVTPLVPPAGISARVNPVWVRAGGGSIAAARNLAVRAARGGLLAFLDDDDRWSPEHLLALAVAFENPEVELAYTDAIVVKERVVANGERVELARRVIAHDWDPEMMRTNDWIPPSAFAVRRGLFDQLDGFDEGFRFSEDWDFLMRAARLTTPRRVAQATVEVRLRESGNVSTDFGVARQECLAQLAARHDLPELEPRSFWEVAGVIERGARAT